jgi:hypothetical protein
VPFVLRGSALALATLLTVSACSSDKATTTSATTAVPSSTTVTSPTSSSGAVAATSTSSAGTTASSAAASTAKATTTSAAKATTAQVDANNAGEAEIAAALQAAGVSNPDRWAKEIVEYRPYSTSDTTFSKLKQNLAKYNPSPAVVDGIVSVLKL